jgi:hypothetical protein
MNIAIDCGVRRIAERSSKGTAFGVCGLGDWREDDKCEEPFVCNGGLDDDRLVVEMGGILMGSGSRSLSLFRGFITAFPLILSLTLPLTSRLPGS